MHFDTQAVDARIRELIARDRLPGVTLCVTGPNGTVFEQAYGVRDAHGTPCDMDTMFGIASMSKSITCLALSMLEAEGRISWDDPVHQYLPSFTIPGAPRDAVTLRTLAMHTSGLPPMEPLEWSIAMNSRERSGAWIDAMRAAAPNAMATIDQVIDYIAHCPYPTVGAPGEVMSYSNEGYAVLSYVFDKAAGVPLEAYCLERIFRPLGMTRTIMDDDCVSARALSGGNITSLFEKEDGQLLCDDHWSVLPPFRGCAMVKSTARDMAIYYQALSARGKQGDRQVIPAEAIEAMVGAWLPTQAIACYGLGLYKRLKAGHVICEHSGGLHGVSTKGGFFLNEGYGFSVLCNCGDEDMDDIMWVLYNAVMGLPLCESHRWFIPAGHDFSDPQMLPGEYIGHEGEPTILRVWRNGNALFASNGKREMRLCYCGGTRFLALDAADPACIRARLEFFIRDGRAWAVRFGSRAFHAFYPPNECDG